MNPMIGVIFDSQNNIRNEIKVFDLNFEQELKFGFSFN